MAATFTAFIDDSKDGKEEKFVIAAAVVGHKAQWNAFNKIWAITLSQAPSINYFHAIECRGLRGQFAHFREDGESTKAAQATADKKRDSLLLALKHSPLKSVSVAIDVQAWKRIKAEHPKARVIETNPYKTALQELIYVIAKDAQIGKHRINFVCDSDNREEVYQQIYRNFRAKNPKTAKKISSKLRFADDKTTYGLQAADMVAHIINRIHQVYGLDASDLPPPPDIAGLMTNVHVWDYEYGMAMLDAQ